MNQTEFEHLFNEDSWDWDKVLSNIDGFVDDLTSYNVLVFQNSDPDIRVVQVPNATPVGKIIQDWFPVDPIQTIVNNHDEDTKWMVPYFRIVMRDFGGDSTINFKLQTFYRKIGLQGFNPRCSMAMVIGLHALHLLESPMDMPSSFCMTSIDPLEFSFSNISEPPATTLAGVSGIVLPYYLPWEVQVNILKFCKSPTAMIIESQIDIICLNWDIALNIMFQQREPRIPANIASAFGASTVQMAIGVATRPLLAESASQLGLSANPS